MVRSKKHEQHKLTDRQPAGQHGFVHVLLLILLLMGVATWGILETSTEALTAQTKSKYATQAAMDQATKGLLHYLEGNDLEPNRYRSIYRVLPPLDFFTVENENSLNDDRFIVSRPGQLPCPDTVGNASDNYPIFSGNIAAATEDNIRSSGLLAQIAGVRDSNDGNLDGLSDPGADLCSSDEFGPLAQGSRFGRLPTSEYFDYVNYNKGVGSGDIIDGNYDRLWYAAARNLTDVSRPINPYQITHSSVWLTLTHSDLTFPPPNVITNAAAVIISPGTRTNDQKNRLTESDIFAPGTFVSAAFKYDDEVHPTLYLEGDNATAAFANGFSSFSDPDNQSADQIVHISADDVLRQLESEDYMRELDSIVDSLEDFYATNSHLPPPASFEREHANSITRRFTRPSEARWREPESFVFAYPHALFLYSYFSPLRLPDNEPTYNQILRPQTAASKANNDSAAVRIQGGRIQYAVGKPVSGDFEDLLSYNNSIIDRASLNRVLLPRNNLTLLVSNTESRKVFPQYINGGDIKFVYLDPQVLSTQRTGFGISPGQPPYTEALYPPSTSFSTSTGSGAVWQAEIPAGTILRTALPTYYAPQGIQQAEVLTLIATSYINFTTTLTISVQADFSHLYGSGPANVGFPGLKLGLLGNLSHFGFSSLLPAGTPIRTSEAITIFGNNSKLRGATTPSNQFAHALFRAEDIEFEIGNCGESGPTPCELHIPSYTPVGTGSHGLLPTPLFPNQLPHATTVTTFNDALAVQGYNYTFDTLGELRYIPLEDYGNNIVRSAMFTAPDGAVGSFPAEVTLHAPIIEVPSTYTISAPNLPPRVRFASGLITVNVAGGVVAVKPFPLVGSNGDIVVPDELNFAGYITVPTGSKFFYPQGSRVVLGEEFVHTHDDFIFSNRSYAHPFNLAGITSELRSRAILAPGAVLQRVPVDVNAILPNGLEVATATTLDLVTLANGGVLEYAQLLHYDRGDMALQPLTRAQAAYRIEAAAIEMVSINVSGYLDESKFAPILAATIRPIEGRPGSGRLEDTNNDFSHIDGYHLYPYHRAYAPMSRRLLPIVQPLLSANSVTLTVAAGHSNLFNNISRADVFAFNVGQNSATDSVTLSGSFNRGALITQAGYFPVDEFGLGVEGMINRTDDNIEIDSTVTVLSSSDDLVLDFDQGVRMQANPGMVWISTLTSATDLGVEFKQYETRLASTPFVAPFSPDLNVATEISLSLSGGETIFNSNSAELALHLNPTTTLANLVDEGAYNPDASDRFLIGNNSSEGQRLLMHFPADVYIADTDFSSVAATTITSYSFAPAGARAEFGYLPAKLDQNSCNSTVCIESLVPGGRVFKDVGYYPINSREHALRANKPLYSIPISSRLPLGIIYVGTGVAPVSLTLDYVGTTVTLDTTTPETAIDGDFQLYLPPAVNINAGTVSLAIDATSTSSYYILDQDIDLILGRGSALKVALPTAEVIATDGGIISIPDDFALFFGPVENGRDFKDLQFNFVSHGLGVITRDASLLDENTIVGELHSNQIVRMRPAIDHYLRALDDPAVLPMIELSWSGVDSEWNHTIFDPKALVFAQNNPLVYSVAENCLQSRIHTDGDCGSSGSGLDVDVLIGEKVRLPSDTVAPGGLVIHPHPVHSREINDLIVSHGTTTSTVNAVRLDGDGSLFLMERTSADPLGYPILSDSASVAASAGSRVTITPPGNGVDFLVIGPSKTEVTIYTPDSEAARRAGYTDPIEVVVGGYTLDREGAAAYQVTVAAGSSLTLGSGSTIYTSTDPNYASVYLGAGSTNAGNDLSGFQMINSGLVSTVTLAANSPVPTEDFFTLPLLYPVGDEVVIGGTPPVGADNVVGLPSKTTITIPADNGYKWSGYFYKSGPVEMIFKDIYLRNYNYLTTSIVLPTTPPSTVTISSGIAMPGHFALNNTAGLFSSDTDFYSSKTASAFTAVIAPEECMYCAELTLDLPSPVPNISRFTLTVADNFDANVRIARGGVTKSFDTSFYNYLVATLSLNTVRNGTAAISPLAVTIDLDPNSSPAAFTVVMNNSATYKTWRGGFHVSEIIDRDTNPSVSYPQTDYLSAIDTYLTTLTTNITVANQFGFVADRSASPDAWEIVTKTDALSVVGPFMLYSNSNLGRIYPDNVLTIVDPLSQPADSIVPVDLPAINDATQIYAPSSNNTLELTRGNADELHYEVHVPMPVLTVNGMEVYGGSRLLPEKGAGGQIHMAQRFSNTTAFVLTLGSGGAVGNIVGGSGAGRPGVYSKPYLFTLSSPASAANYSDPNVNISYQIGGTDVSADVPPIVGGGFPTVFFHHPEEVLDVLDMRQLDAVAYANPVGSAQNLLSLTTDLIQFPALHQISFVANAEISIYPHVSNHPLSLIANGDVDPFTFPAATTLRAIHPTRMSQETTVTTTLDDNLLYRNLPGPNNLSVTVTSSTLTVTTTSPALTVTTASTLTVLNEQVSYTDNDGTLVTDDVSHFRVPVNITIDSRITSTLRRAGGVNVTRFTKITSSFRPYHNSWPRQKDFVSGSGFVISSVLTGLENRDTGNFRDYYQNLWIRIANDMTVTLGTVEHTLFADAVINPFLGTYLNPLEVQSEVTDKIAIVLPQELVPEDNIIASRPALTLPRGITLGFSPDIDASFTDVKAVIAYSPKPNLFPSSCSQAPSESISFVNQLPFDFLPGSDIVLNFYEWHVAFDDAIYFTIPGLLDNPVDGRFGLADICMLLDTVENTDFDRSFTYKLRDSGSSDFITDNDILRMVGGRLRI